MHRGISVIVRIILSSVPEMRRIYNYGGEKKSINK